jgi:hypothetical protein
MRSEVQILSPRPSHSADDLARTGLAQSPPRSTSDRGAFASNLRTYTRGMNPNPPYLATVVIAVLLMVVGLSLEGSLFSIGILNQVLGDVLAVVGVKATQELGRILIVASPTLLIIGSLVRGI